MRTYAAKALRWWTALVAVLALFAALAVVTVGTPSSGDDHGGATASQTSDDDHDQLFVKGPRHPRK